MLNRNFRQRGSVLAIVMSLAVILSISYFGMHTFVSNRSTQIQRVIEGLELKENSKRKLMELMQSSKNSRLSQTNTSYSTSVSEDGINYNLYADERRSKTSRLINADIPGRYYTLDSIHYMVSGCSRLECYTAVAEEVFSPEPLMSGTDYSAWDVGFPQKPVQPIRAITSVASLSPLELKQLLNGSCNDMAETSCRHKTFEVLRGMNRELRQNDFSYATLIQRLRHQFPALPAQVSERGIQNLLNSYDIQKISDRDELYWSIASLNLLNTFAGPKDTNPDTISLREPRLKEIDPASVQAIVKRWFPSSSIKSGPPDRWPELYFYDGRTAIQNYLLREKLEEEVLKDPSNYFKAFSLNRNLAIFPLRYEISCLVPPTGDATDFNQYIQNLELGKVSLLADCDQAGPWKIAAESEKPEPALDSPMIYIGETPWVSLLALVQFFNKLGGISESEFPQDISRAKQATTYKSNNGKNATGLFVIPSFLAE